MVERVGDEACGGGRDHRNEDDSIGFLLEHSSAVRLQLVERAGVRQLHRRRGE